MLVTALALSLAAAPAAPETLKLVAPGLQVVGLDAKLGEFLTEHTAQSMKLAGVDVVTQREMQSLLGLERQKQLLGCSDAASSCMAELASALGADGVLLGDIAKFGGRIQLNLKVVSSTSASTVAAYSDTVGTEDAALDSLTRGANQMAGQAASALNRSLKLKFVERPAYRRWALLPLVVAVVGGGGSAGLLVAANQNHLALINGTPTTEKAGRDAQFVGQLEQTLGWTLVGVAGAALITAGVLFLYDLLTAPAPTGPASAAPVVSGVWP